MDLEFSLPVQKLQLLFGREFLERGAVDNREQKVTHVALMSRLMIPERSGSVEKHH